MVFSCGEKHTDLELVILSDYQLFSAASWRRVKFAVRNSAVLVDLAGDRLAFSQNNQESRASCPTARTSRYQIYISMHKLDVIC